MSRPAADVQQHRRVGSGSYLLHGPALRPRRAGRARRLGCTAAGRVTGWLCLVLFLALCFVLAIGGGRGPLLATALPLLIPVGLGIRLTTRRILYSRTLLSVLVLLLAVPAGLALYTAVTDQRLGTVDRLERLLEGRPGGRRARVPSCYAKVDEFWSRGTAARQRRRRLDGVVGQPDFATTPTTCSRSSWSRAVWSAWSCSWRCSARRCGRSRSSGCGAIRRRCAP